MMTCGILLVTHPGVGSSLLNVATRLLRQLPLKTEAYEVPFDADLDALLPTLRQHCAAWTAATAW